jgi:hypothetical protein
MIPNVVHDMILVRASGLVEGELGCRDVMHVIEFTLLHPDLFPCILHLLYVISPTFVQVNDESSVALFFNNSKCNRFYYFVRIYVKE